MAYPPVSRPPQDPWSKVKFSHDSEQLRKGGLGAAAMVLFFGTAIGAVVGGFVGFAALRYVGYGGSYDGPDGETGAVEPWVLTLLIFTAIGAALGLSFAVYCLVQERITRGPSERDSK